MIQGYFRVAASTPKLAVADPVTNAKEIEKCIVEASERGVSLLVFPELSLTGYTCGDLFFQRALRESALDALFSLVDSTRNLPILSIVGIPIEADNKLYNCAAVFTGGNILGFVPKSHLPNYGEFYERRHFAPGSRSRKVVLRGIEYELGTDQLFVCAEIPGLRLAVEICEDLWVPSPPSVRHTVAGATVIANLSASDETIAKASYRRTLVSSLSARCICGYIYADAGFGESTTDMVFAGHNLIAENGKILSESRLFSSEMILQDLDGDILTQERIRQTTYPLSSSEDAHYVRHVFSLSTRPSTLLRAVDPYPFVPSDLTERERRCEEILSIQATGLATRLSHTGIRNVVIGMSGGLDSTLAYLVCIRAFALLDLPLTGIHAVTMPGFGTTSRTYDNACQLASAYGTSFLEISIEASVHQHFRDIRQDPKVLDVVYENSQARERTQILMDLANQCNALVIGTGDLSELALGWATYNGDHMSMYAVNSSIPKTLVRYLISYAASSTSEAISRILNDILETPVSPELLPHKNDQITQVTEDLVGPYVLHDFFLYYFMRLGFPPEKIFLLARIAFTGTYDDETIEKWLTVFLKRFFAQQFKRSCLPDGPKVGSVTLSPRADWRMPSDASVKIWLDRHKAN